MYWDLQALEALELIERRSRCVPEERNNDLDELDDHDFKARSRLQKDTADILIKS